MPVWEINRTANVEAVAEEILTRLRHSETLSTARVRAVRREYTQRIAAWNATDVFRLARRLIGERDFMGRFVAYELVHYHYCAIQTMGPRRVTELGWGIDSWESVDTFALFIAGPAWRDGKVRDSLIHRWTTSKSRWWQRAALVSTVPLNNKTRGGHGDAARTLAVCRTVLDTRDDMVVKAMSWALRELAKRQPAPVREFVHENKRRLASRIVREVRNKLRTGLKNPKKNK